MGVEGQTGVMSSVCSSLNLNEGLLPMHSKQGRLNPPRTSVSADLKVAVKHPRWTTPSVLRQRRVIGVTPTVPSAARLVLLNNL